MTTVILKKGRDHSVRCRHPWIFSGAVERIEGECQPGETVSVRDSAGEALGLGSISPSSQIVVRMLSFDPSATIDDAFIGDLVRRSIAMRDGVADSGTAPAMRLVNAEADGLPGVVIDRYGEWLVGQFTTAGAEMWKGAIVKAAMGAVPSRGFFERSDADVRRRDGLGESVGTISGDEPPAEIDIREGECRYLVDVRKGHKTGFYLDQRENRAIVGNLAAGRDVLNVFSYTGGFGVAAMKGGAKSVENVDISSEAMALCRRNFELNGVSGDVAFTEGNAFEVLRRMRDSRRSFDLIILDPPKFADSKGRLMGALRGYKDLNLLAMKLLRPGGMLATFSCSGLVTPDIFRKVVQEAALDAGRDMRIVRQLRQAPDHPESLFFPEGLYLKGLLLA